MRTSLLCCLGNRFYTVVCGFVSFYPTYPDSSRRYSLGRWSDCIAYTCVSILFGPTTYRKFEKSIYRWAAQCLYSPLVIVGESLHKVCFSWQIFHALNECRQKSKSDTSYQPQHSKSLVPNAPRMTIFSSVLLSVSVHKHCSFSTFTVVNQYIWNTKPQCLQ